MYASEQFIRIIIRRPHAYFFLDDRFKESGGVRKGTPAGCVLADGTTVPLPGLYVLDQDGVVQGHSALTGDDPTFEVLALLEEE